MPMRQIARELKVSPNVITGYAGRHWPQRPEDVVNSARFLPKGPEKIVSAKRLARGATTLPPLASLQ
jgi:hypothetical protein